MNRLDIKLKGNDEMVWTNDRGYVREDFGDGAAR